MIAVSRVASKPTTPCMRMNAQLLDSASALPRVTGPLVGQSCGYGPGSVTPHRFFMASGAVSPEMALLMP